jgi:hypothetical protein
VHLFPHAIASSQHPYNSNLSRRFLLPIDYAVWPDQDLLLQAQIRDPKLRALKRNQGAGALSATSGIFSRRRSLMDCLDLAGSSSKIAI